VHTPMAFLTPFRLLDLAVFFSRIADRVFPSFVTRPKFYRLVFFDFFLVTPAGRRFFSYLRLPV